MSIAFNLDNTIQRALEASAQGCVREAVEFLADKHGFDCEESLAEMKLFTRNNQCKDRNCDSVGRTHSHTFPDECNCEEGEDGKLGEILLYIIDDPDQEDELQNGICIKAIEDPSERIQFTMKYAQEHNAEIYTEVDLDNGEVGYSRGVRFIGRINQGLYVVVKQ